MLISFDSIPVSDGWQTDHVSMNIDNCVIRKYTQICRLGLNINEIKPLHYSFHGFVRQHRRLSWLSISFYYTLNTQYRTVRRRGPLAKNKMHNPITQMPTNRISPNVDVS